MRRRAQPRPQVAEAAPQTALEIITPEQLADRLQIETGTVYELTRSRCSNPLPAIKVGKVLRFDWRAVELWLFQRTKGAA